MDEERERIEKSLFEAGQGANVVFITGTPRGTLARAMVSAKKLTWNHSVRDRDLYIGRGVVMFRRADEVGKGHEE